LKTKRTKTTSLAYNTSLLALILLEEGLESFLNAAFDVYPIIKFFLPIPIMNNNMYMNHYIVVHTPTVIMEFKLHFLRAFNCHFFISQIVLICA